MTARAQLLHTGTDRVRGIIACNGVNPRTGRYTVDAPTTAELCALAEGRAVTPDELAALALARHASKPTLGVGYGIDPNDLEQAGWGVVFASNDAGAAEKLRALKCLTERRMQQATALYKVFSDDNGVRPEETGREFLARFGDAEGPVAVHKVPYFLLLVGSAAEVSFAVQTELSSRHAVGRLDFETLDDLERYANAVVAREAASDPHVTRAAFFATENDGDVNTSRSLNLLATPLADSLQSSRKAWHVARHFAANASKSALSALLSEGAAPSLLFTASHGLALDCGDAAQRALQGALVTQEWPGLQTGARDVTAHEYFAGADVSAEPNLAGMIAVLFACFTGGTPALDEFLPLEDSTLRALTPEPFVAALPQRLLCAGAGAVVGHVERAWSSSFWSPDAGTQIRAFEEAIFKLADGWRVGAAIDVLNVKCNEIANSLANALRLRKFGKRNDDEVASLVLSRTDAANYIIVGDPATRLVSQ